MNLTIYSSRLFAQTTGFSGPPLAQFSNHSAAFEASCRLRQPGWRPLGGTSHLSAGDVAELERLRVSQ